RLVMGIPNAGKELGVPGRVVGQQRHQGTPERGTRGARHGAGAATLKSGLERDFVVFETRVRRRRTGWTRRCRAARRTALATAATLGAIPVAAASATTASVSAASATAAVSTAFAAPAGAAEHLHLVGDDLGGVAFDAFLVRVLVGAQRAFHVHLPAFLQV